MMAELYPRAEPESMFRPVSSPFVVHGLQRAALITAFMWLGSTFLATTLEQAVLPTLGLWILIFLLGLRLIDGLQRRLADPYLRRLHYVWIAKLCLTLFLLYAGWIPQLDQASSSAWGYDPQRYYAQAQELVANNWVPDFISLNYIGVLYYYGVQFSVFGHNPVVPALINAFITLVATLLLVRVGYEIKTSRGRNDWTIGLAMVFPEVLWYDVMTSRETLVMALLTIMLLTAGEYLIANRRISLAWTVSLVASAGLCIGLVRTPMLLPAAMALGLLFLLCLPQHKRRLLSIVMVLALTIMLVAAPMLSVYLGSYDFTYERTMQRMVGRYGNEGSRTWSDQSIGQLLRPTNPLQAVLYTFPRALLYVVAPLPRINFNLSGLLQGAWSDWQALLGTMSSILNLLLYPLAIASLIHVVHNRRNRWTALALHIPFWVLFVAIAAGNQVIHPRYRVMAVLLFCGCVWLGISTPKRVVLQSYLLWFGLLSGAALFYFTYKTFA